METLEEEIALREKIIEASKKQGLSTIYDEGMLVGLVRAYHIQKRGI